MTKEKNKYNITSFRFSNRNAWIKDELKKLAQQDGRSLNHYVERVLLSHVEQVSGTGAVCLNCGERGFYYVGSMGKYKCRNCKRLRQK